MSTIIKKNLYLFFLIVLVLILVLAVTFYRKRQLDLISRDAGFDLPSGSKIVDYHEEFQRLGSEGYTLTTVFIPGGKELAKSCSHKKYVKFQPGVDKAPLWKNTILGKKIDWSSVVCYKYLSPNTYSIVVLNGDHLYRSIIFGE